MRIYESPAMDDAAVDAVLELLDEAEARTASTEKAERWARAAVEALAPLDLEPPRRAEIEALAAFFVHRSA